MLNDRGAGIALIDTYEYVRILPNRTLPPV
jgi:hypothetical protein